MSRLAALSLFLAAGACHRTTGPDENYQRASALYQQLYASQLDDAYGDPRMDEVVSLLRKVDGRSVDAQSAQTMLGAIQRGREALAKERTERESSPPRRRPPPGRASTPSRSSPPTTRAPPPSRTRTGPAPPSPT